MPSEIVDRVARVLMDAATAPIFRAIWNDQPDEVKTHWRFCARAAIEALREPTEGMISAARCNHHPRDEETWQTMIDAALSEPGSPAMSHSE